MKINNCPLCDREPCYVFDPFTIPEPVLGEKYQIRPNIIICNHCALSLKPTREESEESFISRWNKLSSNEKTKYRIVKYFMSGCEKKYRVERRIERVSLATLNVAHKWEVEKICNSEKEAFDYLNKLKQFSIYKIIHETEF